VASRVAEESVCEETSFYEPCLTDLLVKVLGVDIGGTGIKGAPVSLEKGTLLAERFRIPTPEPATPHAVGDAVKKVVEKFKWSGAIGCGFPATIKNGVVQTEANLDPSWAGCNAVQILENHTGCRLTIINDADAAGLAEMEFGAGKGQRGVVIVLTLGTGIGSSVFSNGRLLPNTELGRLKIRGREAGLWASARAREAKHLSWKKWAKRVNEFIAELEALFSPDLIIIGGGASKRHEKFFPLLKTRSPVLPAQLGNDAGIIGAALAARSIARVPKPNRNGRAKAA
jgi:polyphosphate glucokinase